MGNPWAPPDQSQPPAQAPDRQPPVAPDGTAWPAPGAPGTGPHVPGPVPPGGPVPPEGAGPQPVLPPDPAGVARASRASAWSAGALLVGVLLSAAPYPAMFLAPVAAVAGLALAIVAVVRAARARARGAVVALPVVLIVSSLAWTGISAQTLLYADATRDYQQCRSAALTHQAQRACTDQLEVAMRERLGSLVNLGGAPATGS